MAHNRTPFVFDENNIKNLLAEVIGTQPAYAKIINIQISDTQLQWQIDPVSKSFLAEYQERWQSSMGVAYPLTVTNVSATTDKKALEDNEKMAEQIAGIIDPEKGRDQAAVDDWKAANQKVNVQYYCPIPSLGAFYQQAKKVAEDNIIWIAREERNHTDICQSLKLLFNIDSHQVDIYENERHASTCIVLLNVKSLPTQIPLKNLIIRNPNSTPNNNREFFNNYNCPGSTAETLGKQIQLHLPFKLGSAADFLRRNVPYKLLNPIFPPAELKLVEDKPIEITGKNKTLLIECFWSKTNDHNHIFLYAREGAEKLCVIIRDGVIPSKEQKLQTDEIENKLRLALPAFPDLFTTRESFFSMQDHQQTQKPFANKNDLVLNFNHFKLKEAIATLKLKQEKEAKEEAARKGKQESFLKELDCFTLGTLKITNASDSITLQLTALTDSSPQKDIDKLTQVVGEPPVISEFMAPKTDRDGDTIYLTTFTFNIPPTTFFEKTKAAAEKAVVAVDTEKTKFLSPYLGIDNDCIAVYSHQYKDQSFIVIKAPLAKHIRITARFAMLGLKAIHTETSIPRKMNDLILNYSLPFDVFKAHVQTMINGLPIALQSILQTPDPDREEKTINLAPSFNPIQLLSEITSLLIVNVKEAPESVCCQIVGATVKEAKAQFFFDASQRLEALPHTITPGQLDHSDKPPTDNETLKGKDEAKTIFTPLTSAITSLQTVDITFNVPPKVFFEAASEDARQMIKKIPSDDELTIKVCEYLNIPSSNIKIYYNPIQCGSLCVVISNVPKNSEARAAMEKNAFTLIDQDLSVIENHAFFNPYNWPNGVPYQDDDIVVYIDYRSPNSLLEQLNSLLSKRKSLSANTHSLEKKSIPDASVKTMNSNGPEHKSDAAISSSIQTTLEELKKFLGNHQCLTPDVQQLIDHNDKTTNNNLFQLINALNLTEPLKIQLTDTVSNYIKAVVGAINSAANNSAILNQQALKTTLLKLKNSYHNDMRQFARPTGIKQHHEALTAILVITGVIISAIVQVFFPGIAHAAIAFIAKTSVGETAAAWMASALPAGVLGILGFLGSRPSFQPKKIEQVTQEIIDKATVSRL